MKMKVFSLAVALLGLGITGCGSSTQKTESGDSVDTAVAPVEEVAEAPVADSSVDAVPADTVPAAAATTEADIELLKTFYKKCVFGTSSPKAYCTSSCLKKLAAANEYDDGGYATWEFRTMNQDGDGPSKVTDVEPAEDGWYTVSYLDMGAKGKTRVLVEDGKIAGYKRVK